MAENADQQDTGAKRRHTALLYMLIGVVIVGAASLFMFPDHTAVAPSEAVGTPATPIPPAPAEK